MPDDTTPASAMRFTTITYPGQKMGKEYYEGPDGTQAATDGRGFHGYFKVEKAQSLAHLNDILDSYDLSQIMVHGVPRIPEAEDGYVHSGVPLQHMIVSDCLSIQRTKDDLEDPKGMGVGSLDSDFDHAPSWTAHIQTPQQHYRFLTSVIPELKGVGLVVRPSGSNGIMRPDGTPYKSTRNFHTHFACDGRERVDILNRLHGLFALRGYAWIMLGSSGAMLERSPVDLALRTPNQPVFAAKPRVRAPVTSERPASLVVEGRVLRLDDLPTAEGVAEAFQALKEDPHLLLRQAQVKNNYVKVKTREVLSLTPNATLEQTKGELKRQKAQAAARDRAMAGEALGPDFIVHTKQFGPMTVQELLDNPRRYDEAKTCDPLEPEYRNYAQTGILFLSGKTRSLVSLAHGISTRYRLQGRYDFDLSSVLEPQKETNPKNTLAPTVTLPEGSERLAEAIASFWTKPRKLGVRSTPGSGKTFLAMKAQADSELEFAGVLGRFTLYLAPMIRNCEEAQEHYRNCYGQDGFLFRGRGQTNPAKPDETMCTNPEHIDHKMAHGTGERSMCDGCPLRGKRQCGYDQQLHTIKREQPSIIFATHAFAYYPVPGWEPDRVIIDEAVPVGGVDLEVNTEALPIAHLQHAKEETKRYAEKVLEAHMQALPDVTDLKDVLRWRHKAMVLEGLTNGERVVWYGGKAYLPEKRKYIHYDKPTMVLDGTLRRPLVETFVGKFNEVVHIDIFRNLRVVQVVGNLFSDTYIKTTTKMREDLLTIADEYEAVFTTKAVREALGKLDDDKYAHLGGSKGLNTWEEAQHAFAVMYGQPPMAAMIALAEIIGDRQVTGHEIKETRYIMMRDGGVYPTEVHGHTDELVSELLRHHREDQILQTIDRLRSTRAIEGEKYLLFCCPVALDLPVDVVIPFEDVRPTMYDKTLYTALTTGSGVVPESPKQAIKFRPDIWSSLTGARNHYKNWGPNWHDGLERVTLQERSGNTKAIYGYRLQSGGVEPEILPMKAKPYGN